MELPASAFPLKSTDTARFYPISTNGKGIPLTGGDPKTFALDRGGIAIHKTGSAEELTAEEAKLRKAAEGFEAIFVRQFLKTMNSTLSGGMFGSGTEGEMYGDIAENALAETFASQGRFGIADSLYRQLSSRLHTQDSRGEAVPVDNTTKAGDEK